MKYAHKKGELFLDDEITNTVMDVIRAEFKIEEDSDDDDRLYHVIHCEVGTLLEDWGVK